MKEKLKTIHTNLIWATYLLLLSGLLLYFPFLRGVFSSFRFLIIWLHDAVGLYMGVMLLTYLTMVGKHWKQLNEDGKKLNLILILIFVTGWSISGLILLAKGLIAPVYNQPALTVHDIFTWAGASYIIFHSLTRYSQLSNVTENDESASDRLVNRKRFLGLLGGLILIIGASGAVFNLLNSGISNLKKIGQSKLVPAPIPAPQSKPPIGGGLKGNFRQYSITTDPVFTNDNWQFTVSGLVNKNLKYIWPEFVKIPRKVQVSDFHCITGWTVNSVTYEGIPLSEMLRMADVKPSAKYVKFISGDGEYIDSLTLSQAHMDDVIIALLMDGEPLHPDYGGPARLIVPKMYGYKSVKWLNGIELTTKEPTGYWEERGYQKDAWVKKT